MDDKVMNILNQLVEGQNQLKEVQNELVEGQKEIKTKLDSVAEETAQLMEFRTEMIGFKHDTTKQLKEINFKMNKVELITSSNWNDILQLKSVR